MTLSASQLAQLPEALFEIGKAIGGDQDPSVLLNRISQLVCDITGADTCSIMLLNDDEETLSAKAAFGVNKSELQLAFRIGEGVAGWVVQHNAAAHIGDVREDDRFVTRGKTSHIRSMICVPLSTRTAVIGTLTATSRQVGSFGTPEVELLNFIAKTIALDVQNIQLHRISVTDPLTGAYNREFLQRNLGAELKAAEARQCPISIAMVDVDHFKNINDSYGHQVGDVVLKEVASRLRGTIRTDDLLIRYGGEEFIVVLHRADAGRAWEVGERMRLSMQRSLIEADGPKDVRISVGVAQHRADQNETFSDLVKRADKALYQAKANGRNRVEVSP